MKLVLDQGLPRSTAVSLRDLGIEAVLAGDIGHASASDAAINEPVRARGDILVTLDADFHPRSALSGTTKPSVIRIRIEGLRGEALAKLVVRVPDKCGEDLERGAAIMEREGEAVAR